MRPTGPRVLRTRRVLVVDDEPANIRVVAEALGEGFDVRFATDGEKALQLAATAGIDLVLLDVVMPGLDGHEVLRRLKSDENTRSIPVIFVTARDEVDDETRGFDLGAVDYITKPVSPPVVRARVRTHIELKEQRDLLEERASIDGLTGIANRRSFDDGLAAWWRHAARSGLPLTLLMLDVDFFKQFNDHYGHRPGDECLRRVAAALAASFARVDELPARYGGEEFAVILPSCGTADARVHAGRLLAAIRALDIPHGFSAVAPYVTVSIGGATTLVTPGDSAAEFVARTDALLYEAKHQGRNRARHADLQTGEVETVLPPASV